MPEVDTEMNRRSCRAILLLLLALSSFMLTPVFAAGMDIDSRITSGFDWILGQELEYSSGKRAFVSGVSSNNEGNRIYVDQNAIAATAFTMYHKVHTSKIYDEKLKSALNFIMSAQTDKKDFYHYWNLTTRKWNEDGALFYWNAYAIEGLAFSAFHMYASATLQTDKTFYAKARGAAVVCVEEWHNRSQQADGRWIFSYPDGSDHAEIDENGMILTALLYLALYEQYWGEMEKATVYTDWAERTVSWMLSQQETDENSWAYGGYYHDESENVQYSDSNGRALFGLTSYLRTITSLKNQTDSTFWSVRASIYVWSDNFLLKMIDSTWGPYCYRTTFEKAQYPKQVLAAAELMRALVEIWVVLGDMKYVDYAVRLYDWITGINEKNTDLQQARNRKSELGGFWTGIDADGSTEDDSNLEITGTTTMAFIYGKWIAIPEFPSSALYLILPTLLTLLFIIRYEERKRRMH